MPPAIQKSSVFHFDAGLTRTIWGVSGPRREKRSMTSTSASASAAMAVRCITALVDPLMARVARTAFSMDRLLRIFRAVRPSRAMRQMTSPVSQARRNRSEYTAGTRAEPGRAMPRTSARQHMVLAVPKKEQDPQVGAHKFSRDRNSSSVMRPAVSIPRASCRDVSSVFRPSNSTPPSMGPPVIIMAGMSSRAAAMSIPGTILSQEARRTRASRWWASATSSMESAMTSLWGRMKCIPR